MSITGHIKAFEINYALEENGASVEDGSGNESAQYVADRNPVTYWRTVASDDTTVETLTVSLGASRSISRIAFVDHNWKQFTCKYLSSGSYVDFSGVYGIDGAKASVSETTFADSTAYYEVTEVVTTSFQITVTKTQTADQEKYLSQFIATKELGTFLGWPKIGNIESDRNMRVTKTLNGRVIVQKSIETLGFSLDLKDYPSNSTYNADFDLIMTLQDRELPFQIWLCGGRRGTTYFKYTLRGFRLKDFLLMQITKKISLSYTSNIYTSRINCKIELDEHSLS